MKKQPKTIDGLINAICNEASTKYGYVIRKFWYCNAGWGLCYVKSGSYNDDKTVVHTYYPTILSCVKGEYKRVVLRKKERGGFFLNGEEHKA